MKTIQITIDESLPTEGDRIILDLYISCPAFIRVVLESALRRHKIQQQEQQYAQGYSRFPIEQDEFDI